MVYARKIATNDQRFTGRATHIFTAGERGLEHQHSIPIDDTVVLCNGCNENLYYEPTPDEPDPTYGYLIYLDKRSLKMDQPYDIYCDACRKRYFPKAEVI